jgi:hypothetical protein
LPSSQKMPRKSHRMDRPRRKWPLLRTLAGAGTWSEYRKITHGNATEQMGCGS